jgi:SUN domain-containing protein 1/2
MMPCVALRDEATDISTAPAAFAVYGYSTEQEQASPQLLHSGVYSIDNNEQKSQTFVLNQETPTKYQFIKLEITSNHGNAEYTCLYRFRVHGEL